MAYKVESKRTYIIGKRERQRGRGRKAEEVSGK